MKALKFLLPIMMLTALCGFAATGVCAPHEEAAPLQSRFCADATPVMVASYWGYVAFPPAMIVALVTCGWLIPRKR
jgi:hypothetical protein